MLTTWRRRRTTTTVPRPGPGPAWSRCPISTEHSRLIRVAAPRQHRCPIQRQHPAYGCHTGRQPKPDQHANYAIMCLRRAECACKTMQSGFHGWPFAAAAVGRHPRRFECAIKIWGDVKLRTWLQVQCAWVCVRVWCDWAVYVPCGSDSAKWSGWNANNLCVFGRETSINLLASGVLWRAVRCAFFCVC